MTAMKKAPSLLDGLIRGPLASFFKARGFTRRAGTWNRKRSGFVDVVNIQASRWNESGKLEDLTINAGVLMPAVFELCWGKPAPAFVKEEDCTVRARIGDLLEEENGAQLDRWWRMTPETSAADLGVDLSSLLEANVLPFLERIESLRDLERALATRTGWQAGTPLNRLYLAITRSRLGDSSGAEAILRAFAKEAGRAWLPRVREVSNRVGVRLD